MKHLTDLLWSILLLAFTIVLCASIIGETALQNEDSGAADKADYTFLEEMGRGFREMKDQLEFGFNNKKDEIIDVEVNSVYLDSTSCRGYIEE